MVSVGCSAEGRITVLGSGTPNVSAKALLKNLSSASFVFLTENGNQLYPNYVYRIVKKHIGNCSTVEKKSPHVLRHSFATHMSNNGAKLNDIKELRGHASLASTQVYTHNTIEQLKEMYKTNQYSVARNSHRALNLSFFKIMKSH